MACNSLQMQEPSIETDKLSYEIFSILESKFLFGYDDQKLYNYIPREIPPLIPQPKLENVQQNHHQSLHDGDDLAGKSPRGKICVLSIDGGGGGMRSIIIGKALAYLEQALRTKSGDPNASIADYFDVAAGAGVGGIFTAMLFATKDPSSRRPVFKGEDTWRFLADRGNRIFRCPSSKGLLRRMLGRGSSKSASGSSSSSSSTVALEKSMKEAFSFSDESSDNKRTFLTLKDTLKPVLIPCYDLSTTSPFVFSRADALETESFDFRLWEICRAASAEPGLFEPVDMQSVDGKTRCVAVDGSLAMSNPTATAITHVLHNKREFPHVRGVEDLLVLSLGTGQVVEFKYEYEEVREWKAKEWVRPVARISGDGSADFVDHAVAMAFGQCRSGNYVRIQANGPSLGGCGYNVDTDPSPDNVKRLIAIADEMMKQKNVESVLFGGKKIAEQSNYEKLDWFAAELVEEHRRRSSRMTPTVAFKQVAPKPAEGTSSD